MQWGPAEQSWIVVRIRNGEAVDDVEAEWAIRHGFAVREGDELNITATGNRFADGQ